MLDNLDPDTCSDAARVKEKVCGPVSKILFSLRARKPTRFHENSLPSLDNPDFIAQVDVLQDGPHLMIAIGPPPQNLQKQINFGRCPQSQRHQ
jgi:hypothetical protein